MYSNYIRRPSLAPAYDFICLTLSCCSPFFSSPNTSTCQHDADVHLEMPSDFNRAYSQIFRLRVEGISMDQQAADDRTPRQRPGHASTDICRKIGSGKTMIVNKLKICHFSLRLMLPPVTHWGKQWAIVLSSTPEGSAQEDLMGLPVGWQDVTWGQQHNRTDTWEWAMAVYSLQ